MSTQSVCNEQSSRRVFGSSSMNEFRVALQYSIQGVAVFTIVFSQRCPIIQVHLCIPCNCNKILTNNPTSGCLYTYIWRHPTGFILVFMKCGIGKFYHYFPTHSNLVKTDTSHENQHVFLHTSQVLLMCNPPNIYQGQTLSEQKLREIKQKFIPNAPNP
jgi:hypothetical protein